MPRIVSGGLDAVEEAEKVLRSEGIIVFPTETVYGVGGLVESFRAVMKVFQVKGRPPETPLTIHVGGIEQALVYVQPRFEAFWRIVEKAWPGPVTVVEEAGPRVPRLVSAWRERVGVRMVDHNLTLEIIRSAGAIVGPSANPSGKPSPVRVEHAIAYFDDHVDLYVDGGEARYGIESTVVEIIGDNRVRVLRAGAYPIERLEELGLEVEVTDEARGLKAGLGGYYRSRPETPLLVVDIGREYDGERAAQCLSKVVEELVLRGKKVLVITVEEHRDAAEMRGASTVVVGRLSEPERVAKNIARLLVEPPKGYDIIVAEAYGERGLWLAVTSKLRSASGGNIAKC